ncbi:MAG: 30S ribosomal protein S6e [Candidatus Woesearchaeota archaeon]
MELKVNIADPKTGKTRKLDLKDDDCKPLLGKKIGDTIKGEVLNLAGYEFKVQGGSDYAGFPMRRDVEGANRKKALLSGGVGMKPGRRGLRLRKTIAGNTIYSKTAQVNLMVVKYGKDPLIEEKKEEPKEGEAPSEAKKEAHADKPKAEPKKEEKPVKETPAEKTEGEPKVNKSADTKEEVEPKSKAKPEKETREASKKEEKAIESKKPEAKVEPEKKE